MRRRKTNYVPRSDIMSDVSKYSSVLNLAFFGVLGLAGWKVYRTFFPPPSPTDKAETEAEKEATKNYTTRPAEESKGLTTLEAELKSRGLVVSSVHQSQANTLNAKMDKAWVDQSGIVRYVKSMSKQTFQLVSLAYKQRELANYRNTHVFVDSDSWLDLFSDKKLYGTLKYHLQVVLSDSEYNSLSSWVNSVP